MSNPSKQKRLLIFASGQLDRMGGVQRSYQILTDYLLDRGWKIDLFGAAETLDHSPKASELAYPLSADINVQIISGPRRGSYKNLVEEVRGISPDVILVVNSARRAVIFSAVARRLEIPLVYSMRGSTEYCLRYLWPCRSIFDLNFKVADGIHLLMPSYQDLVRTEDRKKIATIPSQIEPATSFASPEKRDKNHRYRARCRMLAAFGMKPCFDGSAGSRPRVSASWLS